jgi:hypothetical protein
MPDKPVKLLMFDRRRGTTRRQAPHPNPNKRVAAHAHSITSACGEGTFLIQPAACAAAVANAIPAPVSAYFATSRAGPRSLRLWASGIMLRRGAETGCEAGPGEERSTNRHQDAAGSCSFK